MNKFVVAGIVTWAISWPVVCVVTCWLIFRKPDAQPQAPAPALQVLGLVNPDGKAEEEARKAGASVQVRTLTAAAETYCLQHKGVFPDTLALLLRRDENGLGQYLKDGSALLDPWGQAYQFDRDGKRNGGQQPDVWTTAPDGTEIGNWPK
jgi:Type II secretion system (T2SS), protein G